MPFLDIDHLSLARTLRHAGYSQHMMLWCSHRSRYSQSLPKFCVDIKLHTLRSGILNHFQLLLCVDSASCALRVMAIVILLWMSVLGLFNHCSCQFFYPPDSDGPKTSTPIDYSLAFVNGSSLNISWSSGCKYISVALNASSDTHNAVKLSKWLIGMSVSSHVLYGSSSLKP